MKATTTVLGWHWLPEDRRLAHPHGGAGRRGVRVGQTLHVRPPLKLCERGLHASRRALDALMYVPGPVICRVELSGAIIEGDDQMCAARRRVVAMADATSVLHEFACRCAESALRRERAAGREPDARSWRAIAVKRAWLKGEATDAARYAAWAAAISAAWAAAAPTRRTGQAAAAAARTDAEDAARYAARYAAWAAPDARDEFTAELEAMLVGYLSAGAGE